MVNNQLQKLLQQMPAGLDVKLFKGYSTKKQKSGGSIKVPIIHDFEVENITKHTDENGEEYILINPPIT